MTRHFQPKIATSQDLHLGDVIYFTGSKWTGDMSQARVVKTEKEAEALLNAANGFPQSTVGAVLVDVNLVGGVPTPRHFREVFRTRGPSNYFHGKQAENV